MLRKKMHSHPSPCQWSKDRGQLSGWQRALFGLYCVIFAFVLPLICWGAYATPGHPHRVPHFVFSTPLTGDPNPLEPSPHHQHGGTDPIDRQDGAVTPEQPKGQASLSLLLFSILILVFLAAWTLARIDQPSAAVLFLAPRAKLMALPILLPPPRPVHFAP